MRKAAGLEHVRFHDSRHTAITTLAEKGLPDWVIQAQVGHVSPAMMKTYSHIRRQAPNEAATALEPARANMTASNLPDGFRIGDVSEPSNPTDRSELCDTKRASEEKREIPMSQFADPADSRPTPPLVFGSDFDHTAPY